MLEHPSLLVNVLVVVGESFWLFSTASQLIKVRRTRNVKGLNPVTQTLNTAGNIGWAVYFGLNHLWFPFTTNVIIFFIGCAILGYILSNRKKLIQGLLAIAIIGSVTSFALISNPSIGGWIGMSYNWIASTPQLVRIIHRRKVSGLSERGIFFAFGAMIFVLAYGLIIHSRPLIAGSVQGLVYESIIYKFYRKYRLID